MKLPHEFIRLPLTFDAGRLQAEIAQFAEGDWRRHPQGHQGNSALPLVAAGGDPANEDTRGPMRPTPHLARCPYLQETLAALGTPIGRARLMRIAGQGEATAHVDTNYYWSQRVRVHIPILTYPGVRFLCGDREAFMDAGECWIFDTWRSHNVLNPDDRPRIHLVADTVGSAYFWELVAQGDRPHEGGEQLPAPAAHREPAQRQLSFETVNFPTVMSPWELEWLVVQICADLTAPEAPAAQLLKQHLDRLAQDWRLLWARYGESAAGWPAFRSQLLLADAELQALRGRLKLTNNVDPVSAVQHWIVRAAVAPDSASADHELHHPPAQTRAPAATAAARTSPAPKWHTDRFERPIFLVSAPRSGSSLLFETLARAKDLFTIGGESHALIEGFPTLTPAAHGFDSNRLDAADATPEIVAALRQRLWRELRDRDGRRPPEGVPVQMLEKTPKNALRIPFLAAAFPDARFLYLVREPHEAVASMIEAWESGKFVTYPNLPGWDGPSWSLLLFPGWRALRDRPLAEVAAAQWDTTNRQILADLAALPAEHWHMVSYSQFLAAPQETAQRLCDFAGLEWDQELTGQPLPLSRHTLTPPDPEKWRAHAPAIEPLLPALQETMGLIAGLAERGAAEPQNHKVEDSEPRTQSQEPVVNDHKEIATIRTADRQPPATSHQPPATSHRPSSIVPEPPATSHQPPAEPAPMRSIHTTSFPQLLQQLGISLFVSTYQAGRLVVLRADGERLNTHFRSFNKPMGLALQRGRLAIGTDLEIREFRNVPAHVRHLEGNHDACFLPRSAHTTGDIQIHEMAWSGDELWFVNTRFSCLCTVHPDVSFVPRWRPPFISALAPEDRCHLNGLALISGRPRYATALGTSDQARGWREQKRDGGVLIDIAQDTIVTYGLSMPHSPRWYADRLWLLNSGDGGIGQVDQQSGRYQEVARLPGFTRGLDFYGRYAFIGLSQVRESATFSGIAIADLPVEQRACGVWVLDLTTGQTVAFVRFEEAIQEIFAIQVVPGLRFPELINDDRSAIAGAFVLPEQALNAVPAALRQP